jgi:hypothetical protein
MDQIKGQMRVLAEVLAERKAQDAQWGGPALDDTRSPGEWIDYIERQALKLVSDPLNPAGYGAVVRARLVKIAALAFAGMESIDRKAAQAVPPAAPSYSYSTNEEMYYGDHDSVREALVAALHENVDAESLADIDYADMPTIHVGERDEPDHVFDGLADIIVDQVGEWLYDEVGEVGDFDVEEGEREQLDALVGAWLRVNTPLSCWKVEKAKAYGPGDAEYEAALKEAFPRPETQQ